MIIQCKAVSRETPDGITTVAIAAVASGEDGEVIDKYARIVSEPLTLAWYRAIQVAVALGVKHECDMFKVQTDHKPSINSIFGLVKEDNSIERWEITDGKIIPIAKEIKEIMVGRMVKGFVVPPEDLKEVTALAWRAMAKR